MKLQREDSLSINLISAYDSLSIVVNKQRYAASLIVSPENLHPDWAPGGFDALAQGVLQDVLVYQPAVVLIGTGSKQRFPPPQALRPLAEAGIGFEIMDTGAACRTYNILASEGRNVAACLLLDA